MRLLFYIHGMSGGGAERVMATLMNGFVKQGHQIRVVYTSSLEPSVYKLDSRIEQVYLLESYKTKPVNILNKIYRRIWRYYAIRKQAKLYNPDFAISFIKVHNNDVLAALLGTKVPVIIGDHTNIERKYPWVTSTLSNILYPHAAGITMITECDYNKWREKYKHVYYIPNPCDIDKTFSDNKRKKVVLGVGRVNQWNIKGFDHLIKAWYFIKDKHPDWKCQIAGAFNESSITSLKQEVSEEKFNSVEFIGFRSDIHEYMHSCEVFCLSSRFEGLPMALLEALNLGCACVAFDCYTGPSEMIVDGYNGLLADNQNVNDLAIKLDKVLTDATLREQFHNVAKNSVKKYSSTNVLSMWNKMFHELKEGTI